MSLRRAGDERGGLLPGAFMGGLGGAAPPVEGFMISQLLADNAFSIAIIVLQGIFGWAVWTAKKHFVSKEEYATERAEDAAKLAGNKGEGVAQIAALASVVKSTEHSVDILTREMKSVPSAESVHKIALLMEEMRGDLKALRSDIIGYKSTHDASLRAVEKQLGLVMQHEYSKGNKYA